MTSNLFDDVIRLDALMKRAPATDAEVKDKAAAVFDSAGIISAISEELEKVRAEMIYTVFPKDSSELPQDFPTYQDAQEYAESLDCESVIESTTGDCV